MSKESMFLKAVGTRVSTEYLMRHGRPRKIDILPVFAPMYFEVQEAMVYSGTLVSCDVM
jgi:hypothetical protein